MSGPRHMVHKVATWISKSPQELKWLQEKKPPERVFEDLKRRGGDPFLHPDISKWTNYVEVYNDLHPESVKPMMTLMEYKEDELIEKVTLGLETDTVHDSLRRRVLKELFQSWTDDKGKPIRPADAYKRMGLKTEEGTEEEVKFTSPKFAVWLDYVAFFNTRQKPKNQVSCVAELLPMFDLFKVVDQLVKTDVGSVNRAVKIAADFGYYLERARMKDVGSILEYNKRIKSLRTWSTAATSHKRKREA